MFGAILERDAATGLAGGGECASRQQSAVVFFPPLCVQNSVTFSSYGSLGYLFLGLIFLEKFMGLMTNK